MPKGKSAGGKIILHILRDKICSKYVSDFEILHIFCVLTQRRKENAKVAKIIYSIINSLRSLRKYL